MKRIQQLKRFMIVTDWKLSGIREFHLHKLHNSFWNVRSIGLKSTFVPMMRTWDELCNLCIDSISQGVVGALMAFKKVFFTIKSANIPAGARGLMLLGFISTKCENWEKVQINFEIIIVLHEFHIFSHPIIEGAWYNWFESRKLILMKLFIDIWKLIEPLSCCFSRAK